MTDEEEAALTIAWVLMYVHEPGRLPPTIGADAVREKWPEKVATLAKVFAKLRAETIEACARVAEQREGVSGGIIARAIRGLGDE